MRRVGDRFRQDAQLRLAMLTAGCLLAEAVIAKNVLKVLFALVDRETPPSNELLAASIVAVTVAVRVLYAL